MLCVFVCLRKSVCCCCKIPFFSLAGMKMVEKEIFVCFFVLFAFFFRCFFSQIKQEERRISLYCFIVSSFPNENDDDDDTTTDFVSF